MKLRRTILWSSRNDGLLKAVALSLFFKNRFVSSTVNNFTYNKIKSATGLHITTIKKRIDTLKKYGLVSIKNNNLVFLSISSSNADRNVVISCEKDTSIKDIEKLLYTAMVVEIQRKKDFVKHLLQTAHDPKKHQKLGEVKRARKLCRKYGYDKKEFIDNGLSYKTIAKKLCISVQKAFDIISFAVEKNIIDKVKRVQQVYFKGIGKRISYLYDIDYTFCTSNNLYRVYANRYTVCAGDIRF